MRFALFLLRAVIGVLFIGHGAQKLLGRFGGHGPEGTGAFFESVGLRPGKSMAMVAGSAELGSGALLTAGFMTPLATATLTSVMCSSAWTVHRPKGLWVDEGGYEYNLVVVAALFAIAAGGPGVLSVDGALGRERAGLGWALLSLGAGVAGAAAVITSGQAGGDPTEAESDADVEVPLVPIGVA